VDKGVWNTSCVRWSAIALGGLVLAGTVPVIVGWWVFLRMPGQRYAGELPPPTPAEVELARELRRHVEALASDIGERKGHALGFNFNLRAAVQVCGPWEPRALEEPNSAHYFHAVGKRPKGELESKVEKVEPEHV
jgi:hypothetical protein